MAVQETAAQLSMALKVQEYPTLKVGNCLIFNEHPRECGRVRLSRFRLTVWGTLEFKTDVERFDINRTVRGLYYKELKLTKLAKQLS